MSVPAQLRGERTAAVVLLGAGPVAAFAAVAVCVLAVVLVPFGGWRPILVVPLLLPAAAGVAQLARWVPVRQGPPVPVWSAAACVLLAAAFAVWAGLTHGEHMVLRRDSGSYALFAQWLATRHGLPVNADLSAFGGSAALAVPGFTLDSPAFYQVLTGHGAEILPQFLVGAPALYSMGWWLNGWNGLFVAPAVFGGLSVLAAGGLTARLVGPRWAPLAAAGIGLTQPMLHAARSNLSEPVATLLVLAAAALAADAVGVDEAVRARRLGLLAGSLFGLAGLVRIDSLREVALLVPVCAALWLRRHPAAAPMVMSALAGTAVSAVPALWFGRPYLATVSGSLIPLVVATVALTVLTVVVVAVHRRAGPRLAGRVPAALAARARVLLPAAATAFVLFVGVVLATRPLWTVAHQSLTDPGDALVASLQQQQGLPVDGARTYAEQSVNWVVWYVGVPAVVAALIALAVAAGLAVRWWLRSGRPVAADPVAPAPVVVDPMGARPSARPAEPLQAAGRTGTRTSTRSPRAVVASTAVTTCGPVRLPVPGWFVPALVGLGSTVLTLYRPGITPDHPWADRRLVPIVLPTVMIAATAAAAWGVRYARRRMPVELLLAAAGAALLMILVPAYEATRPLATKATELGEPSAVAHVCGQLRPGDVVVGVTDATGNDRAQNEWVQDVRGVCGHPSAALRQPPGNQPAAQVAALDRLAGLVRGAGGRLVVLSAAEDNGSAPRALQALGQRPRRAVLLHTFEDNHLLTQASTTRSQLVIDVWLATWQTP